MKNTTFKSFEDLPYVITVDVLADVLGVGLNTAYNIVHSGAIKSVRVGSQIRISKNSLAEYLGEAV